MFEFHERKKQAERDAKRKTIIGSGDRSEKIRTYNYPQSRITDHRINLSLYNLEKVLGGDMAELVAALKEYEIQQRLKNL